jgi:hypothetical protein
MSEENTVHPEHVEKEKEKNVQPTEVKNISEKRKREK